jgi:DNA-binding PadR family transcriptional regulator
MTAEGLISMEEKNENGRIRKYYFITDIGKLLLEDLKQNVKELSSEVSTNKKKEDQLR